MGEKRGEDDLFSCEDELARHTPYSQMADTWEKTGAYKS